MANYSFMSLLVQKVSILFITGKLNEYVYCRCKLYDLMNEFERKQQILQRKIKYHTRSQINATAVKK